MGEVLALRNADRLESLVLCDTTGSVPSETGPIWAERIQTAETRGMSALAPEILERWLSDDFRRSQREIIEGVRNMIIQTPVPGYVECCRAISQFDVLDELSKVTTPTLIMVGERDISTPVGAAEAMRDRIQDSELIVVPGALHLTNIQKAELFTEKLLAFLAKRS